MKVCEILSLKVGKMDSVGNWVAGEYKQEKVHLPVEMKDSADGAQTLASAQAESERGKSRSATPSQTSNFRKSWMQLKLDILDLRALLMF